MGRHAGPPTAVVATRIPAERSRLFRDRATALGLSPSRLLEALVERELDEAGLLEVEG